MLATKGLDTSRVGFIGWSMGGYGALLLGGALGPARTAAICAVAPGAVLPTTARPSQAGAFDGPADWFAYSVYGTPALSEIPLRIDCGAKDRYYDATKQFVASLRRPPVGGVLRRRARRGGVARKAAPRTGLAGDVAR